MPYCGGCGKKVQGEAYCEECSNGKTTGWNNCHSCGAKLPSGSKDKCSQCGTEVPSGCFSLMVAILIIFALPLIFV